MIPIKYTTLAELQPVDINYAYNKSEPIHKFLVTYKDGLTLYSINSFKNYQDVIFNRDTTFVLTSSIKLEQIFLKEKDTDISKVPGTVLIQPRNRPQYFWYYNVTRNTVEISTTPSNVYVTPVPNTNEVEILIDNKYLQVDFKYPYTIRLNDRSIDPESINRQRFIITYENGTASFKTLTQEGYRYLTINLNFDNTLRATGLVLNDARINDYVFNIVKVSDSSTYLGFEPTNSFVTYYFDVENAQENNSITINKNITGTTGNYLFTFPVDYAAKTGQANVNIATLKNVATPAGGITPTDNSYSKDY